MYHSHQRRSTSRPSKYLWIALLFCLPASVAIAADADAVAISANIQARHMPFGTIADPVFAAPGSDQITGYTRCGDSAIWTGHYLAAEAFRYKVTRAADALANITKAVAGIQALTDVTGTDLLARCQFSANSPYAAGIQSEESHNGIHNGAQPGTLWVGNTSRDQYSGVFFGLAVAYDMLDAGPLKDSIAALASRHIDFLLKHLWTVTMPDGSISTTFIIRPDQMLTILQIGAHMNPAKYASEYASQSSSLSSAVLPPVAIETLNDDSYFKFNLDFISLYNLLRLETGSRKSAYQLAYDVIRNHTANHQNAFFDVIDRALNGPNAARDAEIVSLLNAWLQRARRDVYLDLNGKVPVCGSQACNPVPVGMRPPSDFLWQRTPFLLAAGGNGTIESAGIDYILPYWMARYYTVIGAFTLQSAAAPSAAIAPDSIASIFGTNLSGPVTVQDSAAVSRPATVLYTSAGQINFVVPTGTAAGVATVTAGSQTGPATIQTVAPTLFSMSGTGAGVAAATAIRTQAANPRLQAPVDVFKCNASGNCTSVPIDVGLDTPVYVTFYGTGLRNRSSLDKVSVTINGVSVPVSYAGPQQQFAGLDQVNVGLILNLRGSGESKVVLTVDGQVSNTVTINIQ